MDLSKPLVCVSWILQIVVAAILAQTLYFKFTAAEESVYIFTTLGIEPWGRIVQASPNWSPSFCCCVLARRPWVRCWHWPLSVVQSSVTSRCLASR